MDATNELTVAELANRIQAERQALVAGERLQVCLWFADADGLESLGYCPEVVPVVDCTVTRHAAGGGIARGGDHLDFSVAADEPRDSAELAKLFLGAAHEYAAETFSSPQAAE